MYWSLQHRLHQVFRQFLEREFQISIAELKMEIPPSVQYGELAFPFPFDLAKLLRRAPRDIAKQVVERIGLLDDVERLEVAGAGYLNIYFDRAKFFHKLFLDRLAEKLQATDGGKIIVEHTNINPNKAAHIGHLRNAALGDTFVRILRALGHDVEVQNYIDNTGVQVADVVVGFLYLEKKSFADVERLIADPAVRFDHYCWDLYAQTSSFYEADPSRLEWRAKILKEIEEPSSEAARLAELVSTAITRAHLATMYRMNVVYDVLPRESEILHLKFWDQAFALLKRHSAIYFEEQGKNKGCWVMKLGDQTPAASEEKEFEEDKIIVRSNGTVTYVGKDIAYQLWKFGLLGRDFSYRPFHSYPTGHVLWVTCAEPGQSMAKPGPSFGRASRVYNVIDVRQSYLQNVVIQGLRALGFEEQAKRSTHFAYEMVALSPKCCEALGLELSDADRLRPYIEVSGRKGLGVKADDLIDQLFRRALQEVQKRNPDLPDSGQQRIAQQIAIGGLRYFLLKYTVRSVIAFDFDEALSFEGETGPYVQYAVVRATNIFRKRQAEKPSWDYAKWKSAVGSLNVKRFLSNKENDDIWELVVLASKLRFTAKQCLSTNEPAQLAKFAFSLAQSFNNFYHKHRILSEPDPEKKDFLLGVVDIVRRELTRALDWLGIEVPEKM